MSKQSFPSTFTHRHLYKTPYRSLRYHQTLEILSKIMADLTEFIDENKHKPIFSGDYILKQMQSNARTKLRLQKNGNAGCPICLLGGLVL